MAVFYLVRHGTNDLVGKALAGRMPGVHLNAQGRVEAERTALALGEKGIQRIISSPLERTRETAEALATRIGKRIELNENFLEIDFGDWNGRTMVDLEDQPAWKLFNAYRSGFRIPNGETMLEVQGRVVAGLEKLRAEDPDGVFAIFSHGDPIKLAIAYYLGIPLDLFTRIETSTACYSVLRLAEWGPQLLCVNQDPHSVGGP